MEKTLNSEFEVQANNDFDLLEIISSVTTNEIEDTKKQMQVKFSEGSTGGMNMIAFD